MPTPRTVLTPRHTRFLALLVLIVIHITACGSSSTPTALHTQPLATTAPPTSNPHATQPPAPTTQLAPPSATSSNTATNTPSPTDTLIPTATATPDEIRFGIIGDYGEGNQGELDVSILVKSWNPDFIITTGDNNYPSGAAETIDQHVGQYYSEFISPYTGAYGEGAERNRFFPTLGNHDWDTNQAAAYLEYFTLPGNERYYDFIWGPVHFFALSSDSREPDGVGASTTQALWLKERLAASTSIWKLVYMHQPPYSSGYQGSVDWIRWPFQEWGATTIIAGHDHVYERLIIEGFPYFTNGLGGGPRYAFGDILAGSQVLYNADWGAMLVVADSQQIIFQFINRQDEVIDSYQINR